MQVPSLPRSPDVHQRARLAQTCGPIASRSWIFWTFWLQSWPQGGVLACADGAIQTLQYPENKKNLDTLLHLNYAMTPLFRRKIFFVQKSTVWAPLLGTRVWIEEYRNFGKIPVVQPPPRNCRAVLSGGGRTCGAGGGDETCKNQPANRPRCAQVEQPKPSGTIRRIVSAERRASAVAAAFP